MAGTSKQTRNFESALFFSSIAAFIYIYICRQISTGLLFFGTLRQLLFELRNDCAFHHVTLEAVRITRSFASLVILFFNPDRYNGGRHPKLPNFRHHMQICQRRYWFFLSKYNQYVRNDRACFLVSASFNTTNHFRQQRR